MSETIALERRRYLDGVEDHLAKQGIKTNSELAYGFPAKQIILCAQQYACDLIAMTTHSRNIFGRVLHGSMADRVIRYSHLPSLILGPKGTEDCGDDSSISQRVIVPLDGESFAEVALPFAECLAGRLSLELLLVHIIDTDEPCTGPLDDARGVDLVPDVRRAATAYLSGATRRLRARALNVSSELLVGIPAEGIVGLTHKVPSIVVMATHGRSGLSRFTEGNTTQSVIRLSLGPVLVIPPKQPDDTEAPVQWNLKVMLSGPSRCGKNR